MADQKVTALTEDTSPSAADVTNSVKDPAGTPLDRKVSWLNAVKAGLLGVLTTNGDLVTRTAGAIARITRADLAADAAFSGTYAPLSAVQSVDDLTAFNAAYGTGITSYDQEFSAVGSSLPSGWSWFNQGSATYAEQLGAGIVTFPAGTGNNWRGVVRGLPSESTWTAYGRISGTVVGATESYVGVILTDGTKIIELALYSATGALYSGANGHTFMDRWTNATTYSAAITNIIIHGTPRYWRVRRNSASSYDFAVSEDGVTWAAVQSAYDVSAFMTPTHIGMGGNIKTNRADQTAIHWFRVR